MAKIEVPKLAAALWRQVLVSEVLVPIWEAESSRSDVSALLEKGLVKIKAGAYPKCLVVLADEKMSLSENEKLVLITLTGKGMTRDELVSWAKEKQLVSPLKMISHLMELDAVTTKQEDGALKFVHK